MDKNPFLYANWNVGHGLGKNVARMGRAMAIRDKGSLANTNGVIFADEDCKSTKVPAAAKNCEVMSPTEFFATKWKYWSLSRVRFPARTNMNGRHMHFVKCTLENLQGGVIQAASIEGGGRGEQQRSCGDKCLGCCSLTPQESPPRRKGVHHQVT